MLSISRNVRVSVRVSICSLLRYRLHVFLPPPNEVICPKFLEIRNPRGKVMERSGLKFENVFFWKWSKIAKFVFLLNLPYKTGKKPRFPMDERPLVEGYIAKFSISLDVLEFLRFG